MTKIDPKAQSLYRYTILSEYKSRRLRGQTVTEAVAEMAKSVYYHPKTHKPVEISQRTIYRWLKAYQQQTLEEMKSKTRKDVGISRAFSEDFINFLQVEKKDDPHASIPELIRRARLKGIIPEYKAIDRTGVWRLCLRLGLSINRRHNLRSADMRRFCYPHRMQLVMADGKHFHAGATSKKRVALCFIDDATRMGLSGVVGPSEDTELFLTGLDLMMRSFGPCSLIYLDQGPGFIANDTASVLSKLGIKLIFGKTAYPEGHGKIERFNRTLKADLLRNLDRRLDVDDTPEALQLRLQHYIKNIYNHSPHEGLNGDTPFHRFYSDERPLKMIQDDEIYRSAFVVEEKRRVNNDNTIDVDGVTYEVPLGYAGKIIPIFRQVLNGKITISHQNGLFVLKPVDPIFNAHDKRAKPVQEEAFGQPSMSAADMKFSNEYKPIIDSEGNYYEREKGTSECNEIDFHD